MKADVAGVALGISAASVIPEVVAATAATASAVPALAFGAACSTLGAVYGSAATAIRKLNCDTNDNEEIDQMLAKFKKGQDQILQYVCSDASHWFIYIEAQDRQRRAIYTLAGDLLIDKPLKIKEFLYDPDGTVKDKAHGFEQHKDEKSFKEEYNRCLWHYLDESKFSSWTKTLKTIRKKVKMINARKSNRPDRKGMGKTYSLARYNCQTTSRELALVIAKSPKYCSFRLKSIAAGY